MEFLGPQDLGYPHQLVVVVVTMEERLLAKYLRRTQILKNRNEVARQFFEKEIHISFEFQN